MGFHAGNVSAGRARLATKSAAAQARPLDTLRPGPSTGSGRQGLLGLLAMKPAFSSGLAVAAACACLAAFPTNIFSARAAAQQGRQDLEVLQLRPNFFMIAGAGGNIGVQVGEDGV